MRRREKLLLTGILATTGCASAGAAGPLDPDAPPPLPPSVDPSLVHFTRTRVQAGDPAPDFTLPTADGVGAVSLSSFRGRPVVLVFGSFT